MTYSTSKAEKKFVSVKKIVSVAYLIELQLIQDVIELPILLRFFQLAVVLEKPMKCQLRLVIDKDLQRLR